MCTNLWLTAVYFFKKKLVLGMHLLKHESEAYLWNGPASFRI